MSSANSIPEIALPKGGGALSGIGEKFSPDLHTGTGNFSVPIAEEQPVKLVAPRKAPAGGVRSMTRRSASAARSAAVNARAWRISA